MELARLGEASCERELRATLAEIVAAVAKEDADLASAEEPHADRDGEALELKEPRGCAAPEVSDEVLHSDAG